MDFNLSREHQLVRKMMAEFTENEVKPIAAETDKTSQYPRENIEKLFDLGVMGMCVPKEYGGAGADPLASAICIEELSKQCASTGDIVATHNGLCCDPIITHGTEAQKAKYLPMLTTGHHVGAFALTEPNAGSEASKGQTEAGQVLGMTKTQIFFKVTLLQVVKRILAPMGNEVITLVKDTSLANTIANKEIIMMAKEYSAKGLIWPLFSTAIFFLVFVGALTLLFGWAEKKLDYFR